MLFGDFFFTVVVGGVLLLAKGVLTKSFDCWFAAGWAVQSALFFLIARLEPSALWDWIATFLLR